MKYNLWLRAIAGAVCAIAVGWLATYCALWAWIRVFLFINPLRGLPATKWQWAFSCLWGLACLSAILFVVGMICTYFWHPLSTRDKRTAWGLLVIFILVSPSLLAGVRGIAIFLFVFSLCIAPFSKGVVYGEHWWPNRGWRHLFGLANDWEREDDEQ